MADTRFVTEYATLSRHRHEQHAASRQRWKRVSLAAGPVVLVVLGAIWIAPPLGMLAGVVGVGVMFFLSIPSTSSVPPDALVGVAGERMVLDRLSELPDDYLVFNQVNIPDPWLPGGTRELDFVVVGPASVFVIEVKNVPGAVYVQLDSDHWPAARRAGCGNRPSWNAMRNPLPQVSAQVRALNHLLLGRGGVARIRPILCFARPGVLLENAGAAQVPVVTGDELAGVIRAEERDAQRQEGIRRNVMSLLGVSTNNMARR